LAARRRVMGIGMIDFRILQRRVKIGTLNRIRDFAFEGKGG
jgi:hypothetical protein|tara:strand:- start:919 stop:1041 length:123 start_codon:yes stop_codon:yes gene_type:complete